MLEIKFMPFKPVSSSLPTNGDMKVAPALAARMAWDSEKQRVTFTIVLLSESTLHALRPSTVRGTLITTFSEILDSFRASLIIVGVSVAVISALTGPSIKEHIYVHVKEIDGVNEIFMRKFDE